MIAALWDEEGDLCVGLNLYVKLDVGLYGVDVLVEPVYG